MEDFENILRVESTFNDFETMQKYFQLPTDDVLLKNVLESDVPVVHNYFLDMLAPEIKPGTFPNYFITPKIEKIYLRYLVQQSFLNYVTTMRNCA